MTKLQEDERKIIAVDFDGTLCEDTYPYIGRPKYNIIEYLQEERQNNKAIIILWTCRTHKDDIAEAVQWCKEHGLIFDYINENVPEQIQKYNCDSRKIFADEYIDDKNKSYYQDISYFIDDGDFAELGVRTYLDIMEYKGYRGNIEYSEFDKCYMGNVIEDKYGNVLKDFVNYEGKTIRNLKIEFANAVDNYIVAYKEMSRAR